MGTALKKTESGYSLNPYSEGDEGEIRELFGVVFLTPRSAEEWTWRFKKNPYGPTQAILARDRASGKLLGQHTVLPVNVNAMGRKIKAAQSVDVMVHPDYRLRGIFEATAKQCFKDLQNTDYVLAYAFPNENSYPGFLRKLNWSRVAFVHSYFMRISYLQAFTKVLRLKLLSHFCDWNYRLVLQWKLRLRKFFYGRKLRNPTVRVSETVPENYESLWNHCSSREVFSIWKDTDYFRWRYDENPRHSFRYYYVERNGEILACSVVVATEHRFEILELIVKDRDVGLAKYLVSEITIAAVKAGKNRVCFNGFDLHFFERVFSRFQREINFSYVFCLKRMNDSPSTTDASNPNNWTVTWGDTDAY